MSLGVLITAGGGGIGLGLAKAFLRRGERVHIGDNDARAIAELEKNLQLNFGEKYGKTTVDVCDEQQVQKLFDEAEKSLGKIDVVVCCAGTAGPTAWVEDISLNEWRRCLAVSLDGAFLCARLAAKKMKKQRGGLIVTFSSTAGLSGYPRRAAYAAAKWGVIGLTKTLAMELGPFGVRVNAICPGAVEGERMTKVIAAQAKSENRPAAAVRQDYEKCSSLRTFVNNDDIAATVLFLASPGGCKISGQALAIDGHTESIS